MKELPDLKTIMSRSATTGELYGPAMEVTNKVIAQDYRDQLIRRHVELFGQSDAEARDIVMQNLGYYAGYYDEATRQRVEELYGAAHPIFGNSTPTPEEAFEMGQKFAGQRL